MMKRLLVAEEALRDPDAGHWYDTVVTIVDYCRSVGIHVSVLAHAQATDELVQKTGAVRALPSSAWETKDSGSLLKRYLRVLVHNVKLYQSISKFLKKNDEFDCVFAPTVLIHHIIGWYLIVRRFGKSRIRRLTLLFLNPPGRYDGTRLVFPRSSLLLKLALRLFRPLVERNRVSLLAETGRAASHFGRFSGVPFGVAAQPITSFRLGPLGSANDFTFGALGFGRYEQGTDLLQSAIRIILNDASERTLRFLIRWKADFRMPNGSVISPDEKLVKSGRVVFVPPTRSDFWCVHAVVLPYRLSSYRDRGSRVAAEAAIAGIPMVCTAGSWIEELMLHCGAGVTFRDENPQDLADAILRLSRGFDKYKRRAGANAAKAKSYCSPSAFVTRLFTGESASLDGVRL